MTMTQDLTRRQSHLIDQLRETDEQLEALRRRRVSIKSELDKIYPEARQLAKPPKERGTVITIWNYVREGYDCRIHTTPNGLVQLQSPNPTYLSDADCVIMALCTTPNGADATKLLAVPQLKQLTEHPKRRINLLAGSNYIELKFTLKGI